MKKSTLILFLAAVSLTACKKDQIDLPPVEVEEPGEDPDCVKLIYPEREISFPTSYPDFIMDSYPVMTRFDVNPFNPDEIVASYTAELHTKGKLVRINLKTKEVKVILDPGGEIPRLASRPRWGQKDWILFSGSFGNSPLSDIYKIKSNGDSLTRLTYKGNCHSPEWNMQGDKFISAMGLTNYSIIFDEYGQELDTVFVAQAGSRGSWAHPSLIASSAQGKLRISDLIKDSLVYEYEFSDVNSSATVDANWIDEENVVWGYGKGIYRTNISGGETIQLVKTCAESGVMYLWSSTYSKQTGKIMYVRITNSFPTGQYPGLSKCDLVRLDLSDGTLEEIPYK
jgi:hypothetical protein